MNLPTEIFGDVIVVHTPDELGADQSDVKCEVMSGGKPVEGKFVHATQGTRRTAAAGMWVFYPFAPLPKGEATVKWTVKGEAESFPFTVGG